VTGGNGQPWKERNLEGQPWGEDDLIPRPRAAGEPMMGPEQIAAMLREMAEGRFPTLGPDDDVMQMTHVEGPEGGIVVAHPFGDDDEKQMAVAAVVSVIVAHRAEAWGQVFHAWTPPADNIGPGPEDPGFVQPREREDRREVVVVHASDGARYLAWMAVVERDGENPPKLGAWDERIEAKASEVGGEVTGPLVDAVAQVRLARASRQLAMEPAEPRTPEQQEAFDRIGAAIEASSGPAELVESAGLEETIADFVTLGILEVGENGLPRPSAKVLEMAGLSGAGWPE
jgi:hypothetical protein